MTRSRTTVAMRSMMLMFVALLSAHPAAARAQGFGTATVRVDPVKRENVQEQRMITGELRARHRSKVAAQEPGIIVEMPRREGELVEAGAVLARLDSRRLTLAREQLDADAAVADAVLEERRSAQAQADRDLELLESSFARGAANPKEIEDARSFAVQAAARVVQAERQADLIAARADLLDERLSDMQINAPFEGVVIHRFVELGEWVGEGEPVVEIISASSVEAWIDPPQRHLTAVSGRSEPIDIRIDATDELLETTAIRVIPRIDPTARTFTLVGELRNEDGRLAPGMSVTGWVPTGVMSEQLTVSKNAILYGESGPFVYVVVETPAETEQDRASSSVKLVPVQLLFPRHERFVVRSTVLREGEQVVVEGNERLAPAMAVIPIPAAAAIEAVEADTDGAVGAPR